VTFSVSVIIPTYNRAGVLPRALDSVISQSHAADEIIVVDDGSTDETEAVIRSAYLDITYLKQNNLGVSAARNLGIRHATGDWIALLDSDDSWLPEKLEAQRDRLLQDPDHRLCHTEEIWIRNGNRVNQMNKHRKYGGDIYSHCLPLCVISPSSAVIHHSLLEDVGLFDEELPACEDYDLWLRICSRESVLFVETPLINKFGGHEDQLSRKHWGMDRFRIRAMEKMLAAELLTDQQRLETLDMLLRKAGIMQQGAIKRGKTDRAATWRNLIERYTPELEQLKSGPQATAACSKQA
jgi:glycosyltransferase involved in cell wall biosynthesis